MLYKKEIEMFWKESSCRCFLYKVPVGTFCIPFVLHLTVNSFKRWLLYAVQTDTERFWKDSFCRRFINKSPIGAFCISFILHLAATSIFVHWNSIDFYTYFRKSTVTFTLLKKRKKRDFRKWTAQFSIYG